MKVEILKECRVKFTLYLPGSKADLPEKVAEKLIKEGNAKAVEVGPAK